MQVSSYMTQRPKSVPPVQQPSRRAYAPKPPSVREDFLNYLRQGWSVSKASRAAGTAPRTVMEWKAADEEFSKAWQDAFDEGTDVIEDAARTRAVDGVERPVFQGGTLVGHIQEYSDTLATLMLHGRRPERYNKQRLELSGPNGGPIQAHMEVEFVEPPAKVKKP